MDKSAYLGTYRRRENGSPVTVKDVRYGKYGLEVFVVYAKRINDTVIEAWMPFRVFEKIYEKTEGAQK